MNYYIKYYKQLKKLNNMNQEKKKFGAEVGKILHLMINSIYINKEIFIRELISNSSDACDKLRYLSQTNHDLLTGDTEFKVSISINKEKKTITIRDTGIGMNKEDLNNNLGTIASSGTQKFLSEISGDKKKDSLLIGQFGVGFYSTFMVADKVTVTTKKAGTEEVYVWESDGKGEYTIENSDRDFSYGTEVVIHVKENELSYVDKFRLKHLIKNYSDHILIPIYFIEDDDKSVVVNSKSALWTKDKSNITKEEYNAFYKTISFAQDEPWVVLHNKNEGVVEFTNLLFIPSERNFDLFMPERKRRVKLYIKRVFITDDKIDIIPLYLRFLRGVIDSEDLPLNISRETLQNNVKITKIRDIITNKVLGELKKQKDSNLESYLKFWNNFGEAIKEGLCEPNNDHEKLLEICFFYSTLHNKMISLDEYIDNCKEAKKTIYYLNGDNPEQLRYSPQIEGFLNAGIDVLLFTNDIDNFWVNVVSKYKDIVIQSVTRASVNLNNNTKSQLETKKNDKSIDDLIKYFKKVLGNLVKDVQISYKLTTSPVCLASEDGTFDIAMERALLLRQQLAKPSLRILEININDSIINKIFNDVKNNSSTKDTEDLVHLLYDQACIIAGDRVIDSSSFAKRLNDMLRKI